ncbi:MAG: thioredoxin family protein [Saprospiraceae bacterium]|nr:thioredoxin family protein [Saprospiraceae bacterium]
MYQTPAVKQLGAEVEVVKIEDIEEILKYNVLTTPVLMIDEVIKTKGRVADVQEKKTWPQATNTI